VQEPAFWVVQALVLAVTGLHMMVEASDLHQRLALGGVVELPVVLHLVPVVYAGFRYGYEGSILTGLWSGVLAIPNIVFWHSERWGWLTDLTFIGVVIALGVVIAVPVERERRQRELAEAASRRLETLNGVAADLAATNDLRGGVSRALEHLVADLPLCRARVEMTEPGIGVVEVAPRPTPGVAACSGELLRVPLDEGPEAGVLVVELDAGRRLLLDDRELLAAAARQIGGALEAGLLRLRERDRLRTYAHEVTRAQERERSRIARDLHDVVAQELTLLARHLDDLDEVDGCSSPRDLRTRADDILDAVRRVSRGLRPPALEDLGLVPSLRSLAADLAGRASCDAEVHVRGDQRRLAVEDELTLYRIAQEAVHNAEQHAAPSRVDIVVDFEEDLVEVAVTDDGDGFELGPELPARAATRTGLGVLGMRERAELAGGSLRIVSTRGGGTTVAARLPAEPLAGL
jgi:signal transduction histidine kinase